jgi:choline dehydrogenase-like flavoprotein
MAGKIYDALVIGSGVAGSFAVKELTERGLEVLLLEAGPDINEKDFKAAPPPTDVARINVIPRFLAALGGQHMQARLWSFDPGKKHLFVNDRQNPYTMEDYYVWFRGKQLGGRFLTFGRMVLRMSDYDFKAATKDGHGDDWPISYEDLAPYYDKVEEFLGVYGETDNLASLPDGKYALTPHLTSMEQAFKAKVEARWPDRKVIPWRYVSPNLKRLPTPILAAKETGRLTIRTDAVVKQITIDPQTGKATGVVFADRNTKKVETVSAKAVVLCASTIESIRLMLNSACPKHPNGLGNSSGLLGRYFMDHTPSIAYGTIPDRTGWEFDDTVPQDPLQICGGVYIPRSQNLDKVTHPAFKRGISYQGTVGGLYAPKDHESIFGLMGFGEMLPYYDNYVRVDPKKKDAWGVPVPHIKCSINENEKALMREQVRMVREMVEHCGYKIELLGSAVGVEKGYKLFPESDWLSKAIFRMAFKKSVAMGALIHEVGGARMGNEPGKSVLNPYNQCWDVKNLFVTDGSSFVTNGMVGPALTIMALTVRACEYIARESANGNL